MFFICNIELKFFIKRMLLFSFFVCYFFSWACLILLGFSHIFESIYIFSSFLWLYFFLNTMLYLPITDPLSYGLLQEQFIKDLNEANVSLWFLDTIIVSKFWIWLGYLLFLLSASDKSWVDKPLNWRKWHFWLYF